MTDEDFLNVKNIYGVRLITPKEGDVGHDLLAIGEPKIVGSCVQRYGHDYYCHIDYLEYKTNIHIQHTCNDYFSLMFPRSSISNYQLMLANSVGVIDNSYTGEILCRFKYIPSPRDYVIMNEKMYFTINDNNIYHEGDKIAQLVFVKRTNTSIIYVDSLVETDRGDNGFGSTGK